MNETTHYTDLRTPIGRLRLIDEDGALAGIYFEDHRGGMPEVQPEWVEDAAPFAEVVRQLEQYFAGTRETFELDLVLDGTSFQQCVWSALREIPYGERVSYGELAKRVGSPGAARAVGRANALNPISIVVPCHRVVGADGSLTGYAGGEEIKQRLLALERARGAPTIDA